MSRGCLQKTLKTCGPCSSIKISSLFCVMQYHSKAVWGRRLLVAPRKQLRGSQGGTRALFEKPCPRQKNVSRKLGKQKRWWNMALTKTKTKGQQGMLKRREGYWINRISKRQLARLRKQWKMNQTRRKAGSHRKRLLVHLALGKA